VFVLNKKLIYFSKEHLQLRPNLLLLATDREERIY